MASPCLRRWSICRSAKSRLSGGPHRFLPERKTLPDAVHGSTRKSLGNRRATLGAPVGIRSAGTADRRRLLPYYRAWRGHHRGPVHSRRPHLVLLTASALTDWSALAIKSLQALLPCRVVREGFVTLGFRRPTGRLRRGHFMWSYVVQTLIEGCARPARTHAAPVSSAPVPDRPGLRLAHRD